MPENNISDSNRDYERKQFNLGITLTPTRLFLPYPIFNLPPNRYYKIVAEEGSGRLLTSITKSDDKGSAKIWIRALNSEVVKMLKDDTPSSTVKDISLGISVFLYLLPKNLTRVPVTTVIDDRLLVGIDESFFLTMIVSYSGGISDFFLEDNDVARGVFVETIHTFGNQFYVKMKNLSSEEIVIKSLKLYTLVDLIED